jgi:hypothetical protein
MADGVLPAGLPPAFTAQVREALGPDKLLVVGLSVITGTADRETALEVARSVAAASLGRSWYAATIARRSAGHRQPAACSPAAPSRDQGTPGRLR